MIPPVKSKPVGPIKFVDPVLEAEHERLLELNAKLVTKKSWDANLTDPVTLLGDDVPTPDY